MKGISQILADYLASRGRQQVANDENRWSLMAGMGRKLPLADGPLTAKACRSAKCIFEVESSPKEWAFGAPNPP